MRFDRLRPACSRLCRLRFQHWRIAHDQETISETGLSSPVVVFVFDDDGSGKPEQGLGLALTVKVGVIPIEPRRLAFGNFDFIGGSA